MSIQPQATSSKVDQDAELLQLKNRFSVAIKAARLGIHDCDITNNSIDWDERVREIWGVEAEEPITYETFISGVHPDDRQIVEKEMNKALDPKIAEFYSNYRVINRKDRSVRWVYSTGKTFFENNSPVRMIGTFEDITERKKAEETLKDSEQLYRTLFENTDDGFILFEQISKVCEAFDVRFLQVNKAYERLTGRNAHLLVGKTATEVAAKVEPEWISVGSQVIKEGKPVHFESYNQFTKKWYEAHYIPFSKGRAGILFRDITERKRAEQSFKEKEKELNCILDSTPTIIFYKDIQGKVIQANRAFAQALNVSKEDLIGKTVFDLYSPEIAQQMTNDDLAVIQSMKPKIGKIEPYESPTGLRWIKTDKIPSFNENGQINGIIGFSEEITEQKIAEEALKQNEESLKSYLEGFPVAIFVSTPDGRIVYVNQAASRLLGYSKEEFLSMHVWEVGFAEEAKANIERFVELKRKGKAFGETRFKRKDGSSVFVILNASMLPDGRIIASTENVTERKQMEAALLASEKKYRNLVNKLPEMVFEIDIKGQVVFANSTALQTLGYTKDELENNFDANRFVAPEYSELSKKNMKTMFAGGMRRSNEYVFIRKNGERLPVLLTSSPIIRDNKIVGARGIVVDLTERKKMEKQLEEKERLAAIGATARMVGHDIRNPLQSMIGEIYLLKTDLKDMPESSMKRNIEESFESIENNILYINKIVADLQDYAKPLRPECKAFNLSDILVSAFNNIYTPDSIKISIDVEKCPRIMSDPEFVRRAITNLVTNAIQAMPDGGSLGISGFKKDSQVIIMISDTGVGIPKDVQAKLFTPMWTTKAKGQGLGLAVVKRLVEALGGKVDFECQEGKGTKFIIELPQKPEST
jgi:PAS domain S-box-containing protein